MTVSSLSFFFSFSFLFLFASKFCRNWQVFTFRRPFFKIADPCKRILVGLTFSSSFNYEISRIFSKTVGELFLSFLLSQPRSQLFHFPLSSTRSLRFNSSSNFSPHCCSFFFFPDRKDTSPPLVNQIQPLFDPSLFSFFF